MAENWRLGFFLVDKMTQPGGEKNEKNAQDIIFLEGLGFPANGAERLKKNRRTRKSPTSGLACLVEGHFDFFSFLMKKSSLRVALPLFFKFSETRWGKTCFFNRGAIWREV